MKQIRLDFCDFNPGFQKTNNFFYNLLKTRYDVVICDQPDYLIYSEFGHENRLHTGIKIFFTGESTAPDFSRCDYAFTCHATDEQNLRLPWYAAYGHKDPQTLIKGQEDPAKILAGKSKFCCFIVSGHSPRKNQNRVDFFHRLSRYKHVDSGGRVLNNIGGPIPGLWREKMDFMRAYKFNICFENRALPGYTTEKLFEAMATRCMPIYWGDPLVQEDFNPRSFLNYADFPSEEALIEKIIEMDRDDAKYLEYARQPFFHGDRPNKYFDYERIFERWEMILSKKIVPVAERKRSRFFGRWIVVKRHRLHPR
jgi:hypothetical protein